MGAKSSGHLKKSKAWNIFHNTDIRPKYRIGGALDFNHNAQEALALKQEIIKKAKEAYERARKPKAPPFKAQNYEWSLVVNLKESSTMQDLNKLAEFFNQKYGFQCYQIAIHRDEGHIDELGNRQINHHAHLEFISLDKETGKNRSRDIWNNHKKMSEMQDDIAQILQMEREPYQKGKVKSKRIEPRALAEIKEQEKQQRKAQISQNLTPKEISEVCENFRKSKKNLGYPKEFFRELSAIKKDTKESSKQELEILLEDLAKNYELQRQINQNLQEQQNKEKQENLDNLKQEIAHYQKHQRETLSVYEENKSLKQENYSLKREIDTQTKQINLLRQENTELKELFEIATRKFFAQLITISTKIKEYFKEDLTNHAKRFMPSIQTFLQDIFKRTGANTQQTQQVQQPQKACFRTLSAQSQTNATAPKSLSDIPQPRASRVKEILAGVRKTQEPAQQGQGNATTQPNIQSTYKPKPRRR